MIDTNPESSISESDSNSMLLKTPTSVPTLAGDLPKQDSIEANQCKDADETINCTSLMQGCIAYSGLKGKN